MTELTKVLIGLLSSFGALIIGLIAWLIAMAKRNRAICEIANQENTVIEMVKNGEIETTPSVKKTCAKLSKKFRKLDLVQLTDIEN